MSPENTDKSTPEKRADKSWGFVEPGSPRQSRLGKASFFLGLTSVLMTIFCGCIFPIGVLILGDHTDVQPPFLEHLFDIVELSLLAVPAMSLTGVCLGIAGLLRKNFRRGLPIAGLILNSLILLAFVVICLWWLSATEDMLAI